MIGTVVTVFATGWLVAANRSGHGSRVLAKPLASFGFLLVLTEPLEPGLRTVLIVIGLALGAVGDLALMGRSDSRFLIGLGAFLFGHIAYLSAFALDVSGPPWLAAGSVVALVVGTVVIRWLGPRLEAPFTVAVPAYIGVICLMLAAGIASAPARGLAALGSVLFTASDVFVARERFIRSSPANASLGLPLYYSAQLLIAWSTVG